MEHLRDDPSCFLSIVGMSAYPHSAFCCCIDPLGRFLLLSYALQLEGLKYALRLQASHAPVRFQIHAGLCTWS